MYIHPVWFHSSVCVIIPLHPTKRRLYLDTLDEICSQILFTARCHDSRHASSSQCLKFISVIMAAQVSPWPALRLFGWLSQLLNLRYHEGNTDEFCLAKVLQTFDSDAPLHTLTPFRMDNHLRVGLSFQKEKETNRHIWRQLRGIWWMILGGRWVRCHIYIYIYIYI